MSESGICDAICDVTEDELQEIEDLVAELTRQLRVAIAVRDALNGRTVLLPAMMQDITQCCGGGTTVGPSELVKPDDGPCSPENRQKPGRKPRRVPELQRKPCQAKRPIEATEKTIAVGRMLRRRGALTKEELADALGWRLQQVAMVLGRSARHFVHTSDGKFDVAPALAKLL